MSELKVIKIELNNHGKPIASIQGTTSYYGISPNDTFYPKSEADKVIADLEESHKNEVEQLLMEIVKLEEERRWRKFPDEKPKKWQKVLFRAKYKSDNIRTWIGEFRNVGFDVFYASAPGWGCEFLPNEIFGWMPLPSAPKEEK